MSAPEASDADLKEAVVSSPATDPVEACATPCRASRARWPGAHHFGLLDGLNGGPLLTLALDMAGS